MGSRQTLRPIATASDKGGRPPHQPTAETRKTVEAMTGFGVTAADVSRVLDITEKTLRKHYRDEVDLGVIKANSKVAQSLFAKATSDGPQSVTAAIFWLKTRAGWKEPATALELMGKDGDPNIRIAADDAFRDLIVALDGAARAAARGSSSAFPMDCQGSA